jgi:hypothetical protein
LRSQFTTSNWRGRRYLPYVFTELGVAMLSVRCGANARCALISKLCGPSSGSSSWNPANGLNGAQRLNDWNGLELLFSVKVKGHEAREQGVPPIRAQRPRTAGHTPLGFDLPGRRVSMDEPKPCNQPRLWITIGGYGCRRHISPLYRGPRSKSFLSRIITL